jgi:BON domain
MEIQTQVVRSLETQPETSGRGLRVEVERGLVRLLGEVPEAVAQAAAQLARWIRGVIGVEDRTTRPGEPSFRRSPHNTGAHRCEQQRQHGDADRAGDIGRSARGSGADRAFSTRRGGGD